MPQQDIYGNLYVLEQLLQERVDDYLAQHGLDRTGYQMLSAIGRQKSCTVGILADALRVDKAFTARKLGALGKRGLVKKKPSPHDSRVNLLLLTPAGRAVVAAVDEIVRNWNNHLYAVLGEEGYLALADIIRRLRRSALQEGNGPGDVPPGNARPG